MTKARKKPAEIGAVLRKISSQEKIKLWAGYISSQEPYMASGFVADRFLERWNKLGAQAQYYAGADSKSARVDDFEHEGGLIVFVPTGGTVLARELWGVGAEALPAGETAYVDVLATKAGSKSIAKNLFSAAERIIGERAANILCVAPEGDGSLTRALKAQGFEEVGRANAGLVFTKKLG